VTVCYTGHSSTDSGLHSNCWLKIVYWTADMSYRSVILYISTICPGIIGLLLSRTLRDEIAKPRSNPTRCSFWERTVSSVYSLILTGTFLRIYEIFITKSAITENLNFPTSSLPLLLITYLNDYCVSYVCRCICLVSMSICPVHIHYIRQSVFMLISNCT